jgi:hypothetical protein
MPTPTASPPTDLLSLLRGVESAPAGDLAGAEHCTRQQAVILLLQTGRRVSLEGLAQALDLTIYIDTDMPVDGTAFWTRQGWRIHVSDNLDSAAQLRTALHEIKHVIDHGLLVSRRSPEDNRHFEYLADLFAELVIAGAAS